MNFKNKSFSESHCLIFAIFGDPGEMPRDEAYNAAFHLDLYCLELMYAFRSRKSKCHHIGFHTIVANIQSVKGQSWPDQEYFV